MRLLERVPLLPALTAGSSSLQQSMFALHGRPVRFGASMTLASNSTSTSASASASTSTSAFTTAPASAQTQTQTPATAPATAPEVAGAAAGAASPSLPAAVDERRLLNLNQTLRKEADDAEAEAEQQPTSQASPQSSSPSTQVQQQQQRLTLASWLGISEQQITRFKDEIAHFLTAIKPSVLDEVRRENESLEAALGKREFREFKAYMQRMHTLEKKLRDVEADLNDVRVSSQVCVCAFLLYSTSSVHSHLQSTLS